jgi:hypothetical protein
LKGLWLWSRPIGDGGVLLHLPSQPDAVVFSADGRRVQARLGPDSEVAFGCDGAPLPAPALGWQTAWPSTEDSSADKHGGRRRSPDGRRELRWDNRAGDLGSATVRVVDVATGADIVPPLVHRGNTRDATFSPDGTLVVTANEDQTVRIWDAATGAPRGAPIFHPSPVSRVSFSPDGLLLASSWGGNAVRVWAAGTGLPVTPPLPHSRVIDLAWSPDSQWLATWGRANVVRLWGMQAADEPAAELRSLAQLLSSHRLASGTEGGLVELSAAELEKVWREAGPRRNRWAPKLAPEAAAPPLKK